MSMEEAAGINGARSSEQLGATPQDSATVVPERLVLCASAAGDKGWGLG